MNSKNNKDNENIIKEVVSPKNEYEEENNSQNKKYIARTLFDKNFKNLAYFLNTLLFLVSYAFITYTIVYSPSTITDDSIGLVLNMILI